MTINFDFCNLIDEYLYENKSWIDKGLDFVSAPICCGLGRRTIRLLDNKAHIPEKREFSRFQKSIILSFCVIILPLGMLSCCALATKSLTNWKGRIKNFQIIQASLEKDLEMVKFLLEKGADPNSVNKDGDTPLIFASLLGEEDIVNYLIQKGAKVNIQNSSGNSALILAIDRERDNLARILLDRGADPNSVNNEGSTPLIIASLLGKENIANDLIQRGAKVNFQNFKGFSALMATAERGHANLARILLDQGADPNVWDEFGVTALHIAVYRGKTEVVKLLLDKGADANIVTDFGLPSFVFAYAAGYKDLGDYLYEQSSRDCQAWMDHKLICHRFALNLIVEEGSRDIKLFGFKRSSIYPSLLNSIQKAKNWLKEAPSSWTSEDTNKIIKAINLAWSLSIKADLATENDIKNKLKQVLSAHQNGEVVILPVGSRTHAISSVLFKGLFAKGDPNHPNLERKHSEIYSVKSFENLEHSLTVLFEELQKEDSNILYIDSQIHEDLQLKKEDEILKSSKDGGPCTWYAAKGSFHLAIYLLLYQKFLAENLKPMEASQKAKVYSTKMYKAWVEEDLLTFTAEYIEKVPDSNPHKAIVLSVVYYKRKNKLQRKGLKIDPIIGLIEEKVPKAVKLSKHVELC